MIDFAELHDLALRITPELAQQQLYIFHDAILAPEAGDVAAFAAYGPCAALQRLLVDRGEWQGPGPAIVYCRDDMPREAAIAILLHELAHVLPAKPIEALELTPEIVAEAQHIVAEFRAKPTPRNENRPPWEDGDHGVHFVRRALHLWWRAAIAGEVVPIAAMNIAGFNYGMSSSSLYWQAIAGEGVKLQHLSFAEIEAIDSPENFQLVWRHDVRHWCQSNPDIVARAAA